MQPISLQISRFNVVIVYIFEPQVLTRIPQLQVHLRCELIVASVSTVNHAHDGDFRHAILSCFNTNISNAVGNSDGVWRIDGIM